MSDPTTQVTEVRTRADDRAGLDEMARRLVDSELAACVHVRGPERSTYRWQGRLVVDDEYELTAVTTADRAEAVVAAITEAHPYELPSVLQSSATATAAYATWVDAETR
ncbi:divalent-cation tolerance protein CutA [Rhabdothermincola salaria]|uniref:divalent-cation tolerance protein CutA n=1 Tax=Rhabdothermincola salaria TaxID=2903142 RepID=UPI001E649F8F|nr:divalent cation tolerance protein CutA [Rhabdothermincola salaria]MCD9623009.1 divalent-cation tolerance protein CutA [Rhabdothermincola salaria]